MAKKEPTASEIGRRGGLKKVPKGFSSLSKAQRVANAKKAAAARWAKKAGKKKEG